MDGKAAQINPIAREPFQAQNKNTIKVKNNDYSNIVMKRIYSTIRMKKTDQ